MLKPGEKQKLKVLRKTDIGYMLVTKNQEESFYAIMKPTIKNFMTNDS